MALGGYDLLGLGVDPALKKAPLLKDLGANCLQVLSHCLGSSKPCKRPQNLANPGYSHRKNSFIKSELTFSRHMR